MYFIKVPKIFYYFFPNFVWKILSKKKNIYLTFDDGPHRDITPQILELLNAYDAKATFFIIGKNAEKYPQLIEQIKKAGHSLGNHSYSHLNGWNQPRDRYIEDIKKCDQTISTDLFRPPFGKFTLKQYNKIKKKYKIIFWTVMPGDFDKAISKEDCLYRSLKNTKKGSIVVFHENDNSKENMLFTLPLLLKHFSNKGYAFKAIESIML